MGDAERGSSGPTTGTGGRAYLLASPAIWSDAVSVGHSMSVELSPTYTLWPDIAPL